MLGSLLMAVPDPALVPDTTPATGAPTDTTAYIYGGQYAGVQWTNGDVSAETEVGIGIGPLLEPSGRFAIAPAGETSINTGSLTRCYWFVRHRKNGQYTAWVHAPQGAGCDIPGTGEGGTGDEFEDVDELI